MIRIGEVSFIDRTNGTIEVLYEDREDSVTAKINCLEAIGIPCVGDTVAVIHRDEGTEEGICLGRIYSEKNPPK